MDDELRHDVLVMTKEKWEAGHSVPGNEKLDDVILFEVFNALFVIRLDCLKHLFISLFIY